MPCFMAYDIPSEWARPQQYNSCLAFSWENGSVNGLAGAQTDPAVRWLEGQVVDFQLQLHV